MKINVEQIPEEGIKLEETVAPETLDLDSEVVKFVSAINIKADVYRITNAVSVNLVVKSKVNQICCRCLEEIELDFEKKLELDFPVEKGKRIIDLTEDIREEIFIDFPMNPLCNLECKGLCLGCGKNLNQGNCGCSKSK